MKINELSKQEIELLSKTIGKDFFHEDTLYQLNHRSNDYVRVLLLTPRKVEYGSIDMTDETCDVKCDPNLSEDIVNFRNDLMSKRLKEELGKIEVSKCKNEELQSERDK